MVICSRCIGVIKTILAAMKWIGVGVVKSDAGRPLTKLL